MGLDKNQQEEYFREIFMQSILNSAKWMAKRTGLDRGLRHCRYAGKTVSTRSCCINYACYRCEFHQAIEDKVFFKRLAEANTN